MACEKAKRPVNQFDYRNRGNHLHMKKLRLDKIVLLCIRNVKPTGTTDVRNLRLSAGKRPD